MGAGPGLQGPGPQAQDPQALVRVSKLLAERGLCSRREADLYIQQGLVLVDGQPVTELGTRAMRTQHVSLARGAERQQAQLLTIILHKPVGYVSHADDDGTYPPAASLLNPENLWADHPQPRSAGPPPQQDLRAVRGLAPAGRLDIDSTGLLVLTQDGRVARALIGEARGSGVEKEYLVRVQGRLSDRSMGLLNHGLVLDGRALLPAQVAWQNEDQLRFVLREGRKRQIRRMCEAVGLRVMGLKRVRVGGVLLGSLPYGSWRLLQPGESF